MWLTRTLSRAVLLPPARFSPYRRRSSSISPNTWTISWAEPDEEVARQPSSDPLRRRSDSAPCRQAAGISSWHLLASLRIVSIQQWITDPREVFWLRFVGP